MSDAQTIANMLHDAGLSDGMIGELAEVSREYINKIRSGKKVASVNLTESLEEILDSLPELYENTTTATPKGPSASPTQQATTSEGFQITGTHLAVGACILVGLLLVCAVWGVRRTYRERQEKRDYREGQQGQG